MQTKNVVSNNLKEFVLGLEAAVKEGYSVVEESVDFHAGYFKALTQKDESVVNQSFTVKVREEVQLATTLPFDTTVEMLDNPGEPNEKLKEIFADLVPTGSDVEIGVDRVGVIEPAVTQKPKRNRK